MVWPFYDNLVTLPFVSRVDVVCPAVVLGKGLASPGLDLRPGLRGIGPEGMVGRQGEWHERERGHIERAVVGVPVGCLRLGAAEADGEEARIVVILLDVEHAVEHFRQGCAHLAIAQVVGQLLIPGHEGEGLHGG